MSEEIICLSSDAEDACIENSTKAGVTSISSSKHQLYTSQREAWRSKQVNKAESMCTCYEQKVRNAQDKLSVQEKYAEKVKLESEESQKKLLNLLANPAYSHLENAIKISMATQKTRYKLLLKEIVHSKQRLKNREKRLAIHKIHLNMLMQTKNS